MTLRDAIYMAVGIVWGIAFVSMFWMNHVDDLKRIIDHKERALKNKKPKITVHCDPDGSHIIE